MRDCQRCNEFNHLPPAYVKTKLNLIETRDRFELVVYNLRRPFQQMRANARGNVYALMIIDHFSHWPEFVTLPDTKAATIATSVLLAL